MVKRVLILSLGLVWLGAMSLNAAPRTVLGELHTADW